MIKKYLASLLLLGLVVIPSFSSASFNCNNIFITGPSVYQSTWTFTIAWDEFPNSDLFCFVNRIADGQVGYSLDGTNFTYLDKYESICWYKSEGITTFQAKVLQAGNGARGYFDSDCLDQPYTSLQCQTEYNLIPISSVDQNYCTTNNLCPACEECQECPIGSGGVSTLYINEIMHIGSPFIYMTIPEEISWDYEYTQGGTNMNIDIEGYNQDAEYISSLIEVQNYKPTSEDFTNVFSNFSSFGGLLVACLFVILIFYFVKKIFK